MLLSKLQLIERVSLLQVACELTPEPPPPFQFHSKAPALQHSHYHRHKADDSRGFYLVLTNASGIGFVSCVIFISSADWWKSSLSQVGGFWNTPAFGIPIPINNPESQGRLIN